MTKEQFAQLLNGRTYGNEITSEEEDLAKENGLLICFGASDDLLEMRGIIYEEYGTYEGGTTLLVRKKTGISAIDLDKYNELMEILKDNDFEIDIKRIPIESEWCPSDLKCSWRISTTIPHATFDIMEDDGLYCRGIVIHISDIEPLIK